MSRCFPFPPPGYDKKIQLDDPDLPKKERHKEKEKKHRREKRDKEKKEGKEKKEKHREKKDRKAKHGDNKEDKEKHRDKGKDGNTPSHEKKGAGEMDAYKDRVEKNSEKIKGRENDKEGATPDVKKIAAHPRVPNGGILTQNSHWVSEPKSSKPVHEQEKEKRTSVQLPGKTGNFNHQRTEGMVRLGSSPTAPKMVGTERSKERKAVDGKVERQDVSLESSRPSGTMSLQNSAGMAQLKPEQMAQRKEKSTNWRSEVKDKIREKEVDDQNGGKAKEKDRNFSVPKNRNKLEEVKQEKVKEMVEVKPMGLSRVKDTEKIYMEPLRLNDGNKKLLATQSPKLEKVDNNGNKMALPHENSKKRKETGLNGVLYEEDVGPKKMARPMSSHPMANNGRNLELCQSPIIPMCNHPTKVTLKDHRINGTVESQSCPKPSQAAVLPDQNSVFLTNKPKASQATVLSDQNSVSLKNKLKPSQSAVLADQNSVSFKHKPKPSQAAVPADQNSVSPKHKHKPSQAAVPADQNSVSLKHKHKPSQTAVPADQNSVSLKNKPPHPDSKYLSQVLSVPKVDLLSDTEDMGWLYHSSKKPRVEDSGDKTTQVWADAVRIESADIYALPYVIPR